MTADWRDEAACRGMDVDLFFPPRNGNVSAEARMTCDRCPVRQACLIDALETGELDFGVRGGLTPQERRQLVRRNRNRLRSLNRAGLRLVGA